MQNLPLLIWLTWQYLILSAQLILVIITKNVKVKVAQSCPTLLWSHGLYSPWNSPGQNTGVGSLSLLQGIFPTQGSNPGLLYCRWILYPLSHRGSPRTRVSSLSLCKRIFLTQELNWGLLHFRQILYHLSYQGSPKLEYCLKWDMNPCLQRRLWPELRAVDH